MYRVAYLGNKWLACHIDEPDSAELVDEVTMFVNEGTPIMYVADLDDLPKDMEVEDVTHR